MQGSPFGKLGELMTGVKSSEQLERERLQAEFDQHLKGKFDRLPQGLDFPSDRLEIEHITVTTPPRGPKTMAYANVVYRPEGAQSSRVFSYSIFRDGRIQPSGNRVPAELAHIRPEEILGEVLEDLKKVDLDFWVQSENQVAPPGDWPSGPGERPEESGPGGKKNVPLDPSRLEFFRQQPGVLFGHITQKEGFKDYRVFFFRGFAVIEHPAMENAAYFIDFEEPLEVDTEQPLTHEAKMAIVEQHWPAELKLTKAEMRQRGFTRVVHGGDWRAEMQKEIDKRQPPPPSGYTGPTILKKE